LLTAVGVSLAAGCVDRQYTILTAPPGAVVLENGRRVGEAPVTRPFRYYGTYRFTLIRDGFETKVIDQPIKIPWYEYFPLDFIAENLIPVTIHDKREFQYTLEPVQVVPPEVVLQAAQERRLQGQSIGVAPPRPVAPLPPEVFAPAPGPDAVAPPPVQPLPPAVGPPQAQPVSSAPRPPQPAANWTPGPR
jgi:hypothetical protein